MSVRTITFRVVFEDGGLGEAETRAAVADALFALGRQPIGLREGTAGPGTTWHFQNTVGIPLIVHWMVDAQNPEPAPNLRERIRRWWRR